MKLPQILATSAIALVGFGLASTAMAQTVVRITGSTAFRSSVHKGIQDSLDSGYTYAYASSGTVFGAGTAIYKGTLNAGAHPSVVIKTFFTGALAGAVDLGIQTQISKWMNNSVTTSTGGTNLNGTSFATETAPPQVAMVDMFASSAAAGVATGGTAGAAASKTMKAQTYVDGGVQAGSAGTVGIVTFAYVMGKISTAAGVPTYNYTAINPDGSATAKTNTQIPFGNITQQQAAALIAGPTPITFFTGNPADQDKFALAVGRNEDSGTRLVAFAEPQTGFGNSCSQFQLAFTASQTSTVVNNVTIQTGGTGSTINGGTLWPANSPLPTATSINWNSAGHSGYNGGGDVVNVLKSTNPVLATSFGAGLSDTPSNLSHAYFVSYVGISDAAVAVAGGATQLSYNGVAYSDANVKNGLYSFWAFEHLYYLGSGAAALTGVGKQVADTIADKIYTVDADTNASGVVGTATGAGIVVDSSVLVTRGIEGGIITGTYF